MIGEEKRIIDSSEPGHWQEALSFLAVSPAEHAQAAMQAEYERDALSLYSLVGPSGMSTERFTEIVTEIATQSSHENHSVPSHLEALLKNNWLMATVDPASLSLQELANMVARYPVNCSENCLFKFFALLGKEAELPKIPEAIRDFDESMRDIGASLGSDAVGMFAEAPLMRRLPLSWSKETIKARRLKKVRRRQRRAMQRQRKRGGR